MTAPPLLVACRGEGTALRGLVRLLEQEGLVEVAQTGAIAEAEPAALARARTAPLVVALDGCASGCVSTLLAERGVAGVRSISLHGLESGARDELATALAAAIEQPPGELEALLGRPEDRPEPVPGRRHGSGDRYLRALLGLERSGRAVAAAEVARCLGISRAAAGEMLDRLEASGLVQRDARRRLRLTDAGRERARRALRRDDVVERFLVEVLGCSQAEAVVGAERLGSAVDARMLERLERVLGGQVPLPPAAVHDGP